MKPADHAKLDYGAADQIAIDWLLASDEPGIRLQVRRDLLGDAADDDLKRVVDGPLMQQLLADQEADGSFGVHPYTKWRGAHWRLVSLVDLGLPAGEPHAAAAASTVLDWLDGEVDPAQLRTLQGRYRGHASQEGNAVFVATRLGMAGDPRVHRLVAALLLWQWPDGGWNCDRRPAVSHSSFYESLAPLLGLAEYAATTGDSEAAGGARRAAEFFLAHKVFKSHRRDRPGDADWLLLQYPIYHYFDVLHGLRALQLAGALADPRTRDAVDLLRAKQHDDGTWHVEHRPRWLPGGTYRTEVVRWERSGPSQMLTLHALRVLRAAGSQ